MKKSEHQKAKIISTARELFASKGYEATTTREINHQVGIADGLLYYYFPHGKRQLLDTIVRDGVNQRFQTFDVGTTASLTENDIEQRLTALFDNMWRSFEDEASYQSFMITVRERMLLSDEQSAWLTEQTNNIENHLITAFSGATAFLNLQAQDVESFAVIIVSIFQKTIYDELLIRGHRHLAPEVRASVLKQLKLLLALTVK